MKSDNKACKSKYLNKINYVMDGYTKRRLPLVFAIILMGSIAELIGVSLILPIINLAIDPNEIYSNRYCKILMYFTGMQNPRDIMILLILTTALFYFIKNAYLAWMNNVNVRFTTNMQKRMAVRLMKVYMVQPYSFFSGA